MHFGHAWVERARDRRQVRRARRFHENKEVGHPVLQRLETPDRPSKLDTCSGVFHGDFECPGHGADLFRGQGDERVRGDLAERPGQAGQRACLVHGGQRFGPLVDLDELSVDEREDEIAGEHVAFPRQRGRERALGDGGQMPFVACPQQRLCGDHGLKHRCGAEYPAKLLENDARLGHSGSGTAEALGHEQPGDADLVAQALPRVGLAEQPSHGFAKRFHLIHRLAMIRSRWCVAVPQAPSRARTLVK
jgi:hypothetical protein